MTFSVSYRQALRHSQGISGTCSRHYIPEPSPGHSPFRHDLLDGGFPDHVAHSVPCVQEGVAWPSNYSFLSQTAAGKLLPVIDGLAGVRAPARVPRSHRRSGRGQPRIHFREVRADFLLVRIPEPVAPSPVAIAVNVDVFLYPIIYILRA